MAGGSKRQRKGVASGYSAAACGMRLHITHDSLTHFELFSQVGEGMKRLNWDPMCQPTSGFLNASTSPVRFDWLRWDGVIPFWP